MQRGRDFWMVEVQEPMGTRILPVFYHTEQDAVETSKNNPDIIKKGCGFTVYQVKVSGKKTVVSAGE